MNWVFWSRGGLNLGWGHVRRSQTLARAALQGPWGIYPFMLVMGDVPVLNYSRKSGMPGDYLPLEAGRERELETLKKIHPDVLVLDDVAFESSQLLEYKKYCRTLAVFSDLNLPYPEADVIIAPQALDEPPPTHEHQLLLAGPKYFILEKNIARLCGRNKVIRQPPRNLLVIMGGSMPPEVFTRLAPIIETVAPLFEKIQVLLGFSYDLDAAICDKLNPMVEFISGAEDISPYLAQADMALASSGYVKYELAAAGVPSVLVSIVEHQDKLGATFAEKTGCAVYAGNIHGTLAERIVEIIHDMYQKYEHRLKVSTRGQEVLDGGGGERILKNIKS